MAGFQVSTEAHSLMRDGAVKGLSIGFTPIPDRTTYKDGIRFLNEAILWEVSLTPIPMNEESQVLSMKQLLEQTRQEDDIRRALDSFRSDFERAISR
jgi:phage head maturation protease